MTNIKAIIFDFDGVFVNKFTTESVKDFSRTYGVNIKQFQDFSRVAADGLDTGEIEETAYFKAVIKEFNLQVTLKELQKFFVEADKKHIHKDKQMFKLLRRLNKKYLTVLLTNTSRGLTARLSDMGMYNKFEKKLFSYSLKLAKPSQKIYRHVLKKLNFKPYEVVFIDDDMRNVESARNCGIISILHKNAKQTQHELVEILESRGV